MLVIIVAPFEVEPALVGAVEQRHIGGVVGIGLADDARLAVRTAAVVADGELFQA